MPNGALRRQPMRAMMLTPRRLAFRNLDFFYFPPRSDPNVHTHQQVMVHIPMSSS